VNNRLRKGVLKMFQKVMVLTASLITVLALSGTIVAQEAKGSANATPQAQPGNRGDRMERRGMRRKMRGRARGGLRALNLTDQQKEQARAIKRANFDGNKAQREELMQLRRKAQDGTLSEQDKTRAKELRRQLHESRQNARTQMATLLTAEQKTKLDEMIKNRREHRGRGRRGRSPEGVSPQKPM
jgi:Spy/CpxP family protein refolding chaperone